MAAREVVAAVMIRDGRVLACRRAPHTSGAGAWEFPGGKVEPDEDPRAALVREIREELGVEVTVGALVDRAEVPVGERVIDLACYLVDPVGPLPASSTDHDALCWVPLADLGSLDWSAPDLPAVRKLMLGAAHLDADWVIDLAAPPAVVDPESDRHAGMLAGLSTALQTAAHALEDGIRAASAAGLDEHRIAVAARLPLADVRRVLG